MAKKFLRFLILIALLPSCSTASVIPTITPIVTTQTPRLPTETPFPSPTPTAVPIGITEIASLGKGWANFIEWSPDRSFYAVGGSLGVHIYDAKSHKEIKFIPRELVSDVEYTPDGQLMGITSFGDLTIMRWSDERVLFEKEESFPVQIIFSPKASSFAYISGCLSDPCSYAIIIGDYITQKDLFRLEIGTDAEVVRLNQIAFNTDGTLLVAARSNGSIYVWETSTGELKATLEGHKNSVNGIEFSPTNKSLLASYSDDVTVRLWDTATMKTSKTLSGFASDIESVSYSPDGSSLEVFTNTEMRTFNTSTGGIISSKEYTDTDTVLLQELRSTRGYIRRIDALAYSPDGQTLVVSDSLSSPILLWDVSTKQIKATIETAAAKLIYSHQGQLLASVDQNSSVYENFPMDEDPSEDKNGEISIWDTASYARLDIIKTKRIDSLIFSPDDTKVAFSSEGKINIWDISKSKVVQIINAEVEQTILLSYSADGDTISAVDAHSFSVKTWDISTGELIHTFTPPSNPEYREAINLSNNVLAIFKQTNVANNTVELWHISKREQLQTLKGVNDYIYPRLTYSPDRKLVAISYWSGITFYCSNTGIPLYVYDKVVNWIKFSFSPDGNYLAIGNDFGKLVIWDVSRIVQEPSCRKP